MFFTTHLLPALALAASVAASPTPVELEPMQYHEIDIMAYETGNASVSLEPRKQVKVCGKTINLTYDRCVTATGVTSSIALGIAGLLYTHSQNRVCTAEEYDDANYQYAVRTKGNCHTTAQRATIQGAIDRYVDDELPESICGVQCMKLTHGGNWRGYVVFGAPDYDWERYLDMCASVSKLGHCESGGKKYVHY